jgi:ribosomal protein S1
MTQLTSVESVLPALRVRALVTGVQPGGLNVQVLGYFAGTIDLTHLGKVDTSSHKVGEKVDARILWDIPETKPRQIALSMLPHVLNLTQSKIQSNEEVLGDTYAVGTILEGLKVVRVEADRGVVVAIGDKPVGFVHASMQLLKTTPYLRRIRFQTYQMNMFQLFRPPLASGRLVQSTEAVSPVIPLLTLYSTSPSNKAFLTKSSSRSQMFKLAK